MRKLIVGLCQMDVVYGRDNNLMKAERMIRQTAHEGAEVAVLPEMFTCPFSSSLFPSYAEAPGGETVQLLGKLAKELNIYIVGGSIPEIENGKIYNTCYMYAPDGNIIAKHRKLHMFDVDLPGGASYKESDAITAGDHITVADTPFGKVGLAICFDMRFAELFRIMQQEGATLIFVPAAFNLVTGPAHWEVTIRMRALDQELFMIVCSPARNPDSVYVSYGHSMIVSPYGKIVTELSTEEQLRLCEIDLDEIEKVRRELPILTARRTDLYETSSL